MLNTTFELSTKVRDFHLCALFFRHTPQERPQEHVHLDFYELVLVKEGSALHVLEGVPLPVGTGNVFLIAPGERHYYDNPCNFGIYNLLFGEELLASCYHDLTGLSGFQMLFDGAVGARSCRHKSSALSVVPEKFPEVLREVGELSSLFLSRDPGYRTAMLAAFLKLLCLLAHHSRPAHPHDFDLVARISRSIEYMKKNFNREHSLHSLAGRAGMSVSSFRQNFKRMIGTTPGEYLLRLRLDAARELLALDHNGITEIAVKTGFNDGNYLARQFKKRFGQTPSEYRAQNSTLLLRQSAESLRLTPEA